MANKRFWVLNRRQAAIGLLILFLTAVVVVLAAAVIPYAYAHVTAAPEEATPICCTDRADRVVSLSFDAAWGDEDVEELIRVLDRHGVKATFFVTGDWVDRCEESVEALHEAGHEIMNLSNSYPNMTHLSRDNLLAEIRTASDKIQAVTGTRPSLFRAPYGAYNQELMETLDSLQMQGIRWNIDSLDWNGLSAQKMTQLVVREAEPGSILLFHVAAAHTAQALDGILETLRAEGYTFLPVSEMIYTEEYILNAEGRQIRLSDPT